MSLAGLRGCTVVLYLYPRDDTPGCTSEATGFTERLAGFEAAGAVVLGLSKDTVAKHEKLIARHGLSVTLLSDAETETIEACGAWVENKNHGQTHMGIERPTFLIDADGICAANGAR